ncbi:serine/threonine kinase [Aureococcus anophagefferens]|nr:serine/threonine kinase [Aureococcus anophagefferens]
MRHRDWGMAQLFEILDEDGDGELDCDEIGGAAALRRALRDLELEELFERSADESGTVDETRRRRLHAFWLLVDRDGDGAIDRDEYLDLHVHLYAAMHFGGAEPPDLAEARRVAEREWDFDSQGRDGLDHDLFNLSFFQLVDAWRAAAGDAAASFADYCSFLLDRVAVVVDDDPRHVDLRWRHDPDGWLGDLPRFRSLRKAIASAVREADAMLGVLGLADPSAAASGGDTAALVEDAEEPAAAAPAPTPAVFDDSVLSGARSAKSLVDPFAGDDRLPPCLDSLAFAGDDAEAGDDATAAPAEADPGRRAGRAAASTPSPAAEPATPSPESPESEAPGDAAAASTASPAAGPSHPRRSSVGRGAVARGAVAAGVRDAVGDAVAVGPPVAASPPRIARAAASPRDAASPAPPSPDAAPAPGAADSSPVLPAALPPARVVARLASRRLPADESESPAATLLLSPASTFLRTLGHPDDDTTAPGDGASDGPGGARRDRAARADTPEDSLSTAPDFASETASSATPPPAGPRSGGGAALSSQRRNRFRSARPSSPPPAA